MPQEEYHAGPGDTPGSQRLTNDDFRRLLMTPRSTPTSAPSAGSVREAMNQTPSMAPPKTEDRAELRRKKKSYYAKLKKQEDDKMAELANKYRDRARERRDGANPDYQSEDPLNTASGYRAVAPDLKSGMDAAERRRQMIQESKFLGGDMEHTHLVKGLDYALLQKVRSEIMMKEHEQEQQMEELAMRSLDEPPPAPPPVKEKEKKVPDNKDEEEMQFKTKIGRNIHRTIYAFRSKHVERSELFAPGRMAYVIDLDEEADSDIPTTIIRSKADVPEIDSTPTLTTNDIVINKLAQILTYLRQGNRHKGKKGKKDKGIAMKLDLDKPIADSIYDDIGEYVPSSRKSNDRDRERNRDRDRDRDRDDRGEERSRRTYFDKPVEEEPPEKNTPIAPVASRSQKLLSKLAQEPEGYAECYPGLDEMQDAIDDSDDEVDYTKMDLGNKKGPVGRWDFDTQEEYSDYMNNKEALPKAAFQYGVKMADGRRTRKHKDKNEKAVLDREWQQIQNIIQKRKAPKADSGPEFKVPRY